ncbi:MAG: cobalamin biosynthesis protein [Pseudomonadota bacterium]
MIVAGFGFRQGATQTSLEQALAAAWGNAAIDRIAAPADKAGAPALRAFAEARTLPLTAVPADALAECQTITPAPAAAEGRYEGSPAEAAALAAAGPGARLAGPRAISADRNATCAIAIGETAP